MEKVQHSQVFLRKRKMMMVLPLLVLPFVTMAFWALGGGKGSANGVQQVAKDKGLNLQLPNANLKADKGLDKMSYYEMAEADSDKLKEQMRSDPYFKLKNSVVGDEVPNALKDEKANDSTGDAEDDSRDKGLNVSPFNKTGKTIAGEKQVYDKLKQINAALDNATAASKLAAASKTNQNKYAAYGSANTGVTNEPAVNNQNVDRLEHMMQTMKEPAGNGGDSEMIAINNMLEKVMDIQHPERLNEKYKQKAVEQKGLVYAMNASNESNKGFYGETNMDGNESSVNVDANNQAHAIEAVVHETQTLVNGATVKLRLLTDVTINGTVIPKDNFIYGTASLTGERLTISINSIRYQNLLLPVAMAVYDMDGMDGIYIPGAITRDVAKQSTDNALQSIALNSLDPSIGTQAASAGIQTAKTLISKKVKLVRVTVKAGYHVLLKDNNNK